MSLGEKVKAVFGSNAELLGKTKIKFDGDFILRFFCDKSINLTHLISKE